MSNIDIEGQQDAEVRHEAYVQAYIDTKLELSRRILTLSSAAVAVLLTVAVNLEAPVSSSSKYIAGSALFSFIVAVITTGSSLWLSPEYLLLSAREIGEEDKSAELESRNERIRKLRIASQGFFLVGMILLFVLGVIAIARL